ncbi:MAG: radical SAM protein [Deltaproteobacteria bacterium]|nr:radical SAM protein [Deltaproteobacteria bacterium]
MRVSVLNPPYLPLYSRSSRSPAVTKSRTLYYPYWLAYAVGVLEADGFEVQFIDAPAGGLEAEETLKRVADFSPALVVADATTPSFYSDAELTGRIKAATGAVTMLVGTHVSATAQESLEAAPGVDLIARCEYDYIVRDAARALREEAGWGEVKGLSFRSGGEIIHNEAMPFISNLDDLPFVSKVYQRHLSGCYTAYFYGANLHPIMVILSGRGCPFGCHYCLYPQVMTGQGFRTRSVGDFVDELVFIKEAFPRVRDVFIEDDTFTLNRRRTQAICQEILSRGLKTTWSANARADADLETLGLMKEAGCRELCVGFESGDQDILDQMGKRLTLEEQRAFMAAAKKIGIIVHGCFLVGNPGETEESLARTLAVALALNPDTAQFYPIMVYPGTKAFAWAEEKGYLTTRRWDEWLTPEGLHNSVVQQPSLSHERLTAWCDMARRAFYLRPSYLAAKVWQSLRHPQEGKRIVKAAAALSGHLARRSGRP